MGKFLYFGYGSNLLAERLHVRNSSAVRRGIGKLKDYRLDFNAPDGLLSKNWGGAPATIVPETGSSVWGALWEIDECDLKNLDNQEGVEDGLYRPITIVVKTLDNLEHSCRSYCLVKEPRKLPNEEERCGDRLPSLIYMTVILKGAQESGLPEEYINHLRTIQTNGYRGGPHCPISFKQ